MDTLTSEEKIELTGYIKDVKKRFGSKLIIPAHHYIESDVVALSDICGDSYKLAVDISKTEAEWIVFCGVRFMAEGASILSTKNQKVLLPDITADCPMADMIDAERAQRAFEVIMELSGRVAAPVVYMNSYADVKNFCGQNEGSVCTSSNADKIVKFYLDQNKPVFFFPDYNLGRNTAEKLGLQEHEIAKVNSDLTIETSDDIQNVKLFLWDGFCPLHQRFVPEDVAEFRKNNPGSIVIVHPEVPYEVAQVSDKTGSTQQIWDEVKASPAGTIWGIGTEINFINRLASECPDKIILPVKNQFCNTMSRITLKKLADTLKSIENFDGNNFHLKYPISVDDYLISGAKIALNTMIDITRR